MILETDNMIVKIINNIKQFFNELMKNELNEKENSVVLP